MSLSLLAPKEFQIIILSKSVHTCSLFQKRVVHTKLDVHGFFLKKEDNAMKRVEMDTVNFNSHVRWLWFSILWSRYLYVSVVAFVCFGDQAYHDEWRYLILLSVHRNIFFFSFQQRISYYICVWLMKLSICFWRPLDPIPKRDSDTTDKKCITYAVG